jgi:hypothetical protein
MPESRTCAPFGIVGKHFGMDRWLRVQTDFATILSSHIPGPLGAGTYTAALSQPIFEGGYLRNKSALLQVRTAPSAYCVPAERSARVRRGVRQRQEQSVKDLQESVNMSLMRYKGGTATYLSGVRTYVVLRQSGSYPLPAESVQSCFPKPDSAVRGYRRRMEITRASRRRGSSAQFIGPLCSRLLKSNEADSELRVW